MIRAVRVEWWKMRRSPVTLTATVLLAVLLPLMAFGFYSVGVNGGTGLVAEKAAAFLVGRGWEAYLGVVNQIASVAMFLGAGVVVVWMFGREHVDGTFSSLFALPVSRRTIAAAKILVLLGWVIVLSLMVAISVFGLGVATSVGPVEMAAMAPGLAQLIGVGLSAGLLALTLGVVAGLGRGYLPGIGALVIIVAAAQVSVLFGIGGWFPFAIPGLMAVSGVEGAPGLSPIQIALIPVTTGLVAWMTLLWWQHAETV